MRIELTAELSGTFAATAELLLRKLPMGFFCYFCGLK